VHVAFSASEKEGLTKEMTKREQNLHGSKFFLSEENNYMLVSYQNKKKRMYV